MGIRGRTTDASIDFGTVWDHLEGVFTLRFNAMYREKFGIFVDYNYLDLGKEKTTVVVGNIEASFTSQILNLAGTYRFLNGPHSLDGVAGIRYTKLDAGINLTDFGVDLDGDHSWVDPIVGLRYNYQISERWTVRLYGDIGGFGAASDFTWQTLGLIEYQPWKNVAIAAGYRAIGTDYESSGADAFTYDATIYGPVVGIDIRW
jgi:opacity protein-like surface antigen